MTKRLLWIASMVFLNSACIFADAPAPPPQPAAHSAPSAAGSTPSPSPVAPAPSPVSAPAGPSLYNFTATWLDGQPVDLGQYRGHVVLVVNTASHGGFTRQYAGLEALYKDYKDKGFFVLGFPSNDFGAQEPGTSQEIATFCRTKFDVTFPMFEKVKTKGDGQSPIYRFLSTGHGQPQWSFHKYLVDKKGQVIQEFPSYVPPASKQIRDAINAALKS